QSRAAMATDVVEAAQLPLAIAQEDDALAEDIENAERSGPGELLLAAGTDPLPAEDPLLLHRQHALGAIPGRGERRFHAGNARREPGGAHVSLSRSPRAAREATACAARPRPRTAPDGSAAARCS